jgi:hypothetical protein
VQQVLVLLLTLFFLSTAYAQERAAGKEPPAPVSIQDNSFLIEEAYNQEPGVVQHINTFMRQRNGDWIYTFTQEWPVCSQKHQLSITLPGQRLEEAGGVGIGDAAINYRYQLLGSGDSKIAVAPRVSVLVPTGDSKRGMGAGAAGLQISLPVSAAISSRLVTHWNAGVTITPSARNELGERASIKSYNLGQSFIWLVAPRFNLMLETVWSRSEAVAGPGIKERGDGLLLNPGLRWAHNFSNGLQIVPGIAVPIGVGPSRGERGIFLYLSFEHPFAKRKQ